MFNLFSKAKNAVRNLAQTNVNTNVLVAKIHSDFDTSTERLLNEAKAILSKNVDTSKGEQLRNLGFVRSKPSIESAVEIQQKQENETVAKHIEHYQVFYPNNKFITEKEVERICKKYGLLCAESEYYSGDVPDKNVKEIALFKLREEECTKHRCHYYKPDYRNHYPMMLISSKEDGQYGWIESGRWGYQIHNIADETQQFAYTKPSFKICASVKDFDTTQMSIKEGYKLEKNIPDPIVLQPVNGGYLIVSKWGLDGQDESLVNQTMN